MPVQLVIAVAVEDRRLTTDLHSTTMSTATHDTTTVASRLFQPSLGVLFLMIGGVTLWGADGGRDLLEAATWAAFGLSQVITAASTTLPIRWIGYGFAAVGVVLFGIEIAIAFG